LGSTVYVSGLEAKMLSLAERHHFEFRHLEQDVLNLVLKEKWEPLPYTYNGQGLGTYACSRIRGSASAERLQLMNQV
jgi:lipopolysaccharide biosynthesis glycosyltransferase